MALSNTTADVTFNGIPAVGSAWFAMTRGESPGIGEITIPAVPNVELNVGDLLWSFGNQQVAVRNCLVADVETEFTKRHPLYPDGVELWHLTLLDRRWAWQEASQRISGIYNVTRAGRRLTETEKTLRELCQLCLEALGEQQFDVGSVSEDSYPEVTWDYDRAAAMLSRLCDAHSLRIAPQPNNSFGIYSVGDGRRISSFTDSLAEATVRLSAPPIEAIVCGCAPPLFQNDFELEPIGLEPTGEHRRWPDLTYYPRGGFSLADFFFNHLDSQHLNKRDFAVKSIGRFFRIKTPFRLPGVPGKIDDLQRILPLRSTQVQTDSDQIRLRPAWVYGKWYAFGAETSPTIDRVEQNTTAFPEGRIVDGFTIDEQRGVVEFERPQILLEETPSIGSQSGTVTVKPAELRLRVAVHLRDEDTRGWMRKEFRRDNRGSFRRGIVKFVRRDDFQAAYWRDESGRLQDNEREIERQAIEFLNSLWNAYEKQPPLMAILPGFRAIGLDGVWEQVTFELNSNGEPTTTVSRGREHLPLRVRYRQRRAFERVAAMYERGDTVPRQTAEYQQRNARY